MVNKKNMSLSSEALSKQVLSIAEKNKDGFTLDIDDMKLVTRGICVALAETQNSFGTEDLIERVIPCAQKNKVCIGGWFNSQDKKFYWDATKVFKLSERAEAVKFARANKQLALYDTNVGEVYAKDYDDYVAYEGDYAKRAAA